MKLFTALVTAAVVACTKPITVVNETSPEAPAAPTVIDTSKWTLTMPPRCELDENQPVTDHSVLARCRSYSQHFVTVNVTTKQWSDDDGQYERVAAEAPKHMPNTAVFGTALFPMKDVLASITYFAMRASNIGMVMVAVERDGTAYSVTCGTAMGADQGLSVIDAACTDIVRSFQLK